MVHKWDDRAYSGYTWITPSRIRIARLQALDSVGAPNSTTTFPCLFGSLFSHYLKTSTCRKPYSSCFSSPSSFFLLQASNGSTVYSLLHCSLFKKCRHLNHHHGKVAVSLAMSPMQLWTLMKALSHSSKWKKKKKTSPSQSKEGVYTYILVVIFCLILRFL